MERSLWSSSDKISPLIEMAVKPKMGADQAKLGAALLKIASEEHGFRFSFDRESGQTTIKVMSELDLEKFVDRLKREAGVEMKFGAPQVAYRETISRPADVEYTYKKQTGGSGLFARVTMHVEPLPRASGVEFVNDTIDAAVPTECFSGVEKAVRHTLENGVLAGFPVIDIKVVLTGGAYHEVDSSALAFEIAARFAMTKGLAKAEPQLLEPIMRVEVVTPPDCMDNVIADLKTRRGHIAGQGRRGRAELIDAMIPLANMFSYSNFLDRLSAGRATVTMQFSHYDSLPLWRFPDGDPSFRPAVGMRA